MLFRSPFGDALGAGERAAALRLDFVDHFLRRAGITPLAFDRRADVIDHHARAGGRHREREIAPDAPARTGDQRDFSFEQLQSRKPGYLRSASRKSAGHSSGPQRRRVSGRYR